VNSRPILCLGSEIGDISIYYLDEPVINPMTKQQDNGKVKHLLLNQFNFFTRGDDISKSTIAGNSKSN
jgi:hypothetical protein